MNSKIEPLRYAHPFLPSRSLSYSALSLRAAIDNPPQGENYAHRCNYIGRKDERLSRSKSRDIPPLLIYCRIFGSARRFSRSVSFWTPESAGEESIATSCILEDRYTSAFVNRWASAPRLIKLFSRLEPELRVLITRTGNTGKCKLENE